MKSKVSWHETHGLSCWDCVHGSLKNFAYYVWHWSLIGDVWCPNVLLARFSSTGCICAQDVHCYIFELSAITFKTIFAFKAGRHIFRLSYLSVVTVSIAVSCKSSLEQFGSFWRFIFVFYSNGDYPWLFVQIQRSTISPFQSAQLPLLYTYSSTLHYWNRA